MKRSILILVSLALAILTLGGMPKNASVQAQGIPTASINFRNEAPIPLIIQGISFVGGTLRKGQPLFIAPGKNAWDTNVPPGPRQYKIYDGTQPSRVLAPNIPVKVLNRDVFLLIRPAKGGTVEVIDGGG